MKLNKIGYIISGMLVFTGIIESSLGGSLGVFCIIVGAIFALILLAFCVIIAYISDINNLGISLYNKNKFV